jgi:hypothetical protein
MTGFVAAAPAGHEILRHKRLNATTKSCWHGGTSSDKPVDAGSAAIPHQGILRYAWPGTWPFRIELKVDAARLIFAFSEPD